jgi:ribosomal protein S10
MQHLYGSEIKKKQTTKTKTSTVLNSFWRYKQQRAVSNYLSNTKKRLILTTTLNNAQRRPTIQFGSAERTFTSLEIHITSYKQSFVTRAAKKIMSVYTYYKPNKLGMYSDKWSPLHEVSLPTKHKSFSVLKSPHVHKTALEHFSGVTHQTLLTFENCALSPLFVDQFLQSINPLKGLAFKLILNKK